MKITYYAVIKRWNDCELAYISGMFLSKKEANDYADMCRKMPSEKGHSKAIYQIAEFNTELKNILSS